MANSEKLFQIDIILRCGREVSFLLEEPLMKVVLSSVYENNGNRVSFTDRNGVTIVIEPAEVAFLITREFIQADNTGMN